MFARDNLPSTLRDQVLFYEDIRELGLLSARSIRAYQAESAKKSSANLLDVMGQRVGRGWLIESASREDQIPNWRKLLKSEVVIDFSRVGQECISNLIARLFKPVVHAIPLGSLSGDWEPAMREELKSDDVLHIAIGAPRAKFCFVGTGRVFEFAVACAAERPPYAWGYPEEDFVEIVESREYLHG